MPRYKCFRIDHLDRERYMVAPENVDPNEIFDGPRRVLSELCICQARDEETGKRIAEAMNRFFPDGDG